MAVLLLGGVIILGTFTTTKAVAQSCQPRGPGVGIHCFGTNYLCAPISIVKEGNTCSTIINVILVFVNGICVGFTCNGKKGLLFRDELRLKQ
jgi:hypothetical protein